MKKSELIIRLSRANPHLSKEDVRRMTDAFFECIRDALSQGQRVELRGFGVFDVKWRPPRERRNPRTGKQVAVQGNYKPFFRYGKVLRTRLNAIKNGNPPPPPSSSSLPPSRSTSGGEE